MYKLKLSHENNEHDTFVCLFNWLDTKLEITEDKSNCIDQERLDKHIVFNYFEFFEYQIFNLKNIDFVKKVLKVYIMFSTKNKTAIINISMLNLEMRNKKKYWLKNSLNTYYTEKHLKNYFLYTL